MELQTNDPDSNAETDSRHELSRVTVLAGEMLFDVGISAGEPISVVINDVIELIERELEQTTDLKLTDTDRSWTFAHLAGEAIDPTDSLSEAGVGDGDLLVIEEVRQVPRSALIEDFQAPDTHGGARWDTPRAMKVGWKAAGIAMAALSILLLPGLNDPSVAGVSIAALAVLLLGFAFAVAGGVIARPACGGSNTPADVLIAAVLLLFGGVLYAWSEVHGNKALPVAFSVVAVVVWCLHLFANRNLWVLTASIWLAVLGLPVSLAFVLGGASPRVLGVVLATTSVVAIYLAPRIAILVSGLSIPRVPTAGEPLDDIETQAGPTVEGVNAVRAANVGVQVIPTEQGMDDQVRRARSHLTGIVVAAAVMVNAGSYLALDVESGFVWQQVAFVVAIAVVACLRGRGHHDVVQSAVLIVCGLVNALVLIVKVATYETDQQVNAGLALIGLTILVAGCGLVAPWLDFSPIMRRRVEIVECVAIAALVPLACWIIGVFAFCRGLRI